MASKPPFPPELEVDFGDESSPPPLTRTVVETISSDRVHPADLEYVAPVPVRAKRVNGFHPEPEPEPPRDDQAEQYLISCCFLDPADLMPQCDRAQITIESFLDSDAVFVFRSMSRLWRSQGTFDVASIAGDLDPAELKRRGGWGYLVGLSKLVPTTIQASSLIGIVRRNSLLRQIITLSRRATEQAYLGIEPVEMLAELETDLRRLSVPTAVRAPLQSFKDFALPADGDKSILLGHRYLNRGDGMVMVGTSGIGKSSMSIQMATLWALGRSAVGIPSNGPLRSLIVQSEDSDGDIAEMWTSMSHALKLSLKQTGEVFERVKIVNERVLRGDRFVASLAKMIELHKPDLVWINPLQAFMDGDPTDSQDLGKFLREGLNGLNNGRFGYVIVHHTTKPATGKDRAERQWHEVMYDMAGGAEIINWARAIVSIRPTATEGQFNLVLAKRGRRAGVTRSVDQGAGTRQEIITTVPLKHAEGKIENVPGRSQPLPVIFWEEREPDAAPEREKSNSGRPPKFEFSDYQNVFPPRNSTGMELSALHRSLETNLPIQKGTLVAALKRWSADGFVEIIRPEGKPTRYRQAL